MWTSDRWTAIKQIPALQLVHLSDIFFKHVSNCEHISEGGNEMVQSTYKLMKKHEDIHEGKWRCMKNYEDFWKFMIRFECNQEVILQSTCKCYGNRITNIDWIILDSEFFLRNLKYFKTYDFHGMVTNMKWAMNGNLKFEIEISVSGKNIWYGRVLRGKVERRLNLVKDWSHKTFLKVDKILLRTFQNFFAI